MGRIRLLFTSTKIIISLVAMWALLSIFMGSPAGAISFEITSPQNNMAIDCNNKRVNFVMWPSHFTNPDATGKFYYNMNIKWKRCSGNNNTQTRAYAIFATGSESQNVCPEVGNYGGPSGGGAAYDCVKYLGSPIYTSGYVSLSCPPKANDGCLYNPGWFKGPSGPGIASNQPSTSASTRSYRMSNTIPNWSNKRNSSGEYIFTANDTRMCQYYKYPHPGFGNFKSGDNCKTFSIKIKWTNKWSISPTTTMTGTSGGYIRPGNTVNWKHKATNSGPDPANETITMTHQRKNNRTNDDDWTNILSWNKSPQLWLPNTSTLERKGSWTPVQGDEGKKICERILATPRAWDNDRPVGSGTGNCATAWQRWRIKGSTTVSGGSRVGNDVTWTHTLMNKTNNNDTDNTTVEITWNFNETGGSDTLPSTRSGSIAKDWKPGGDHKKTLTNTYKIIPSDGGRRLCQNIEATPGSRTNADVPSRGEGKVLTEYACVEVPYDYELKPKIATDSNGFVEAGQDVNIMPGMNNAGPTYSESAKWEVYRYIYKPGENPSREELGTSEGAGAAPCAYHKFPSDRIGTDCKRILYGSKEFGVGDTPLPDTNPTAVPIDNLDAGSKVCFSTSVSPWKSSPGDPDNGSYRGWRHTALECMTVVKKPKVAIMGGDARVQGSINTSYSSGISSPGVSDKRTYGSWGEYGIFSKGVNSLMSSGLGLRDGYLESSSAPSSYLGWSTLTFANKSDPLGRFQQTMPASNAISYFKGLSESPGSPITDSSRDISTLPGGVYNTGGRDLILTGVIENDINGRVVVIRSTGTVTIRGEEFGAINSSKSSIADMSQVVILAKNINIEKDVKEINAWLLAGDGDSDQDTNPGTINTCSDDGGAHGELTINTCSKELVITGAVITDKIYLRRTAGAESNNPGIPAETIHLNPLNQLWAYNYANKQDRAQTTYLVELPPRF
ncbi:hypothetical protein H6796_01245 [Candidatus Nomurabacteria bacterium]|nr:hypothetical protein [Candidatus Nomurabacteria bacterium]